MDLSIAHMVLKIPCIRIYGQTNTKGLFVIQAEGYVDGSNAGGSGIQLWTKDVSGPKQAMVIRRDGK